MKGGGTGLGKQGVELGEGEEGEEAERRRRGGKGGPAGLPLRISGTPHPD